MPPLLTFYGDDFTGSSAVMEILAFGGVPTLLFLDVPTPEMLARVPDVQAVGIAGIARSKDPAWMETHLPRYLEALAALGAPLLHYKTCSTFDSAPHLGSIGRAIELGLTATGAAFAPLVVGAPKIGRYQIFGTLFATFDGTVHRLDRHPVMAKHPATPMTEADLCRHLDHQTTLAKAVVDWRALCAGRGLEAVGEALRAGARIVALDVFDDATLAAVGDILWEGGHNGPVFAVGSQGVEYALMAHWRKQGAVSQAVSRSPLLPAAPLLVVSGSCSEVTARQIAAAEGAGFEIVPVDACMAREQGRWQDEIERAALRVGAALVTGRNVLAATAKGPGDPAIAAFKDMVSSHGEPASELHARIGNGLGQVARRARLVHGLSRVIFSGGDTSGHAMLALGGQALEPIAPLADGVPLLRMRATDDRLDGLEVALKGGQMGDERLFIRASTGEAAPSGASFCPIAAAGKAL